VRQHRLGRQDDSRIDTVTRSMTASHRRKTADWQDTQIKYTKNAKDQR